MPHRAFFNPFEDAPRNPAEPIGVDGARLLSAIVEIEAADEGPVILWIARSVSLYLRFNYVIQSRVTFAFAPGAVITLGPGVTLDLQGPVEAGTEQRFHLVGDGRVRFSGELDEIHASWWGDGVDGARPVTHALSALWDRYDRGLEPAPIRLAGPYVLHETLRVAPPTVLLANPAAAVEVVLRGRRYGVGDSMTFQPRPGVTLDSLVNVAEGVSLVVENVGFDLVPRVGRPLVGAALTIVAGARRSRIEACAFRLADSIGIVVSPTLEAARWGRNTLPIKGLQRPTVPTQLSHPVGRVAIARCDFDGTSAKDVGIRAGRLAPIMMDVSDCMFRGIYDIGIAVVGSELMTTNCAFDNAATPSALDPFHAADIVLGDRVGLSEVRPVLLDANCQLTATHCASTSPNFLVVRHVYLSADPGGMVLSNVLHEPVQGKNDDLATAVRLIGPQATRSVVLQGCEFGAPVRLESVERIGTSVVVDLGTRFTSPEIARRGFLGGISGMVVSLSST